MDQPLWSCEPPLQALTVERLRAQSRRVDAVKTTDVHGKHLATVFCLGAGKRFDTAVPTEKMMNDPSVEQVIDEVVFAGEQGELLRGCKSKPKPVFSTSRAVASDGFRRVRDDPVANLAAVTSAVIGLCLSHHVPPAEIAQATPLNRSRACVQCLGIN